MQTDHKIFDFGVDRSRTNPGMRDKMTVIPPKNTEICNILKEK